MKLATYGSVLLVVTLAAGPVPAQNKKGKPAPAAQPQKIDEEYTRLIKEYLQDPAHHHRTGGPHAGLRHRPLARSSSSAASPASPAN